MKWTPFIKQTFGKGVHLINRGFTVSAFKFSTVKILESVPPELKSFLYIQYSLKRATKVFYWLLKTDDSITAYYR